MAASSPAIDNFKYASEYIIRKKNNNFDDSSEIEWGITGRITLSGDEIKKQLQGALVDDTPFRDIDHLFEATPALDDDQLETLTMEFTKVFCSGTYDIVITDNNPLQKYQFQPTYLEKIKAEGDLLRFTSYFSPKSYVKYDRSFGLPPIFFDLGNEVFNKILSAMISCYGSVSKKTTSRFSIDTYTSKKTTIFGEKLTVENAVFLLSLIFSLHQMETVITADNAISQQDWTAIPLAPISSGGGGPPPAPPPPPPVPGTPPAPVPKTLTEAQKQRIIDDFKTGIHTELDAMIQALTADAIATASVQVSSDPKFTGKTVTELQTRFAAEKAKLKKTLAKLKAEKETAENELVTRDARVTTLTDKLKQITTEKIDAENQLKSLGLKSVTDKKSLAETIAEKDAEIIKLKASLEAVQKEREAFEIESVEKQRTIDERKAEIKSAYTEMKKLYDKSKHEILRHVFEKDDDITSFQEHFEKVFDEDFLTETQIDTSVTRKPLTSSPTGIGGGGGGGGGPPTPTPSKYDWNEYGFNAKGFPNLTDFSDDRLADVSRFKGQFQSLSFDREAMKALVTDFSGLSSTADQNQFVVDHKTQIENLRAKVIMICLKILLENEKEGFLKPYSDASSWNGYWSRTFVAIFSNCLSIVEGETPRFFDFDFSKKVIKLTESKDLLQKLFNVFVSDPSDIDAINDWTDENTHCLETKFYLTKYFQNGLFSQQMWEMFNYQNGALLPTSSKGLASGKIEDIFLAKPFKPYRLDSSINFFGNTPNDLYSLYYTTPTWSKTDSEARIRSAEDAVPRLRKELSEFKHYLDQYFTAAVKPLIDKVGDQSSEDAAIRKINDDFVPLVTHLNTLTPDTFKKIEQLTDNASDTTKDKKQLVQRFNDFMTAVESGTQINASEWTKLGKDVKAHLLALAASGGGTAKGSPASGGASGTLSLDDQLTEFITQNKGNAWDKNYAVAFLVKTNKPLFDQWSQISESIKSSFNTAFP